MQRVNGHTFTRVHVCTSKDDLGKNLEEEKKKQEGRGFHGGVFGTRGKKGFASQGLQRKLEGRVKIGICFPKNSVRVWSEAEMFVAKLARFESTSAAGLHCSWSVPRRTTAKS